jgi:hypothetical protein
MNQNDNDTVNALPNGRKRFTLHHILDGDYAISRIVLARAGTRQEAQATATELSGPWHDRVAIWDHFGGLVDFGGEEDLAAGYYPLQPICAVRVLPETRELEDRLVRCPSCDAPIPPALAGAALSAARTQPGGSCSTSRKARCQCGQMKAR